MSKLCASLIMSLLLLAAPSWAMEHYTNVLQDQNGRAISGATVSVYLAGTTTLASIYSDNGSTAKSNPFTTSLDGVVSFYAADGAYDVTYRKTGLLFNDAHTRRIALYDAVAAGGLTGADAFPPSPSLNQAVLIIDDTVSGDCLSDGGTETTLCLWDGSNWVAVVTSGGGGVTGWPTVSTTKEVTWANAFANALCIGGGVNPLCIYEDSTLGGLIRPKTLGNVKTYIWSGFNWCAYSIVNDRCMLTITPGSTDNDKYTWTSGERPVKTIPLFADMLYPRGSSTLVTDTALVSGGLVDPYITTTASDSDGFYRKFRMPPNWDGGTITATITVINTNATPANAFRVDVSGECWPAGTAVGTTISTTGEQSAIITFGSSGSCGGSACSQNDPASATTAAITINGTPAGGNYCGFQAQTNAAGTTETVAGIKIVQMDIHYKISKGF